MTVFLVGCGGIGGWLGQVLAKTLTPDDTLHLFDADTIEERNIDRQLFGKQDIGKGKVYALRNRVAHPRVPKIEVHETWFTADVMARLELEVPDVIMVGADNNAARTMALDTADRHQIPCIVAANEYDDAEAYIYMPPWLGSRNDPRVYYPELLNNDGFNPASPGCTGAAAIAAAPQLALANMCAASYAMWLYYAWMVKSNAATAGMSAEARADVLGNIPYLIRNTWGRVLTRSLNSAAKEAQHAGT